MPAKRKDTYFGPKLIGGSRRGGVRPLLANLSAVMIRSEKRGLGSALQMAYLVNFPTKRGGATPVTLPPKSANETFVRKIIFPGLPGIKDTHMNDPSTIGRSFHQFHVFLNFIYFENWVTVSSI